MKRKLTQEYYRRTRNILRTELNAKNKITAINTLAVSVIHYSYGIIKWTQQEIRKLDRQTRKLTTMHGALHPKADVDRLYIPRRDGGRGMSNLENTYAITQEGINNYLKLKQNDKHLGVVYRQLKNRIHSRDTDASHIDIITESNPSHLEAKRVKAVKEKYKERKQMSKHKDGKINCCMDRYGGKWIKRLLTKMNRGNGSQYRLKIRN
ncbi:hypothetical protein LSTR_LSTR009525 [Laodelphax striatellus]|uniref:Uncharacterized protein n=1 Tax=Laodelphax striatellus TaxID=195883 RepID=A0A482XRT6_LAOST|nr:hypothetical protein LSTR_LSTR009525 [Laodelphax striatellus]